MHKVKIPNSEGRGVGKNGVFIRRRSQSLTSYGCIEEPENKSNKWRKIVPVDRNVPCDWDWGTKTNYVPLSAICTERMQEGKKGPGARTKFTT